MKKKGKGVDEKLDELTQIVAQGFSEVRADIAEDLHQLRSDVAGDLHQLRGDIDIMLDRHIGTFRKDYDDLAARVKKLEQTIFK